MKTITFSIALAATFAVAGCRAAQKQTGAVVREGGGRPIGEFVGAPAIKQIFREQILDADVASSKSFDLLAVAGTGIAQNAKLLGANADGGERNDFRGGVPNPVGVLLWYKVFKIFADAVGQKCGTGDDRTLTAGKAPVVTLSTAFVTPIKTLCDDASTPEASAQAAAALWSLVVGDGAPAEGEVFAKTTGSLWTKEALPNPKERVSAVVLAAFMNPYFLLEHN